MNNCSNSAETKLQYSDLSDAEDSNSYLKDLIDNAENHANHYPRGEHLDSDRDCPLDGIADLRDLLTSRRKGLKKSPLKSNDRESSQSSDSHRIKCPSSEHRKRSSSRSPDELRASKFKRRRSPRNENKSPPFGSRYSQRVRIYIPRSYQRSSTSRSTNVKSQYQDWLNGRKSTREECPDSSYNPDKDHVSESRDWTREMFRSSSSAIRRKYRNVARTPSRDRLSLSRKDHHEKSSGSKYDGSRKSAERNCNDSFSGKTSSKVIFVHDHIRNTPLYIAQDAQ